MCKPSIDLTPDMDVKVNPYCYVFPISIVARSKSNPCDLCIVRAHAIFRGICLRFPLITSVISTMFGFIISNGTPMYL
jgi:hypothetical protein